MLRNVKFQRQIKIQHILGHRSNKEDGTASRFDENVDQCENMPEVPPAVSDGSTRHPENSGGIYVGTREYGHGKATCKFAEMVVDNSIGVGK